VQRTLALLSLLVIIAGLALGYFIAPKYQPPNEAGQGRLRKRAEKFYRALRQMDYGEVARMMTPARQFAETATLRDAVKATQQRQGKLSADTRTSLGKAADSIKADQLDIRIEGNWALTSGSGEVYESGSPVTLPLEDLVWICINGDWWNYDMTNAELAAYGNPPDFARNALMAKKNKPAVHDLSAPAAESPVTTEPGGAPDTAGGNALGAAPAPDAGPAKPEGGHGS
jgi:hypothetical protein